MAVGHGILGGAIPIEHKALLLGAVFLIDFMFFEKKQSNSVMMM